MRISRMVVIVVNILSLLCLPIPECHAVRQVINGADQNYGDTGTPAVNGAEFVTDNTLTTTADGQNFAGTPSIKVDTDNIGTLTITGNTNITGAVGAAGLSLKQLNLDGIAGKTVAFGGTVYATNMNFGNDGTATLADTKNLNAVTTTSANNTGNLTFLGTSAVNGDIGTAASALKKVNVDGAGKTVTFNDDVFATTLNFGAAATAKLADASTLTAATTTSANNTGVLTCNGNATVTGNIGAGGAILNQVNANGAAGKFATFDGDIFATTLNFGGNGTVVLTDGSDLTAATTTATNNTGKLTFNGTSTVTGDAGVLGTVLARVNADGGAGKTVTFNNDIFATTLNFGGDGTVALADNADINGAVATTTAGTGALTFAGDSNVTGNIGSSATNLLRQVTVNGAAGETVAFGGNVRANTLHFGNDATVTIADTKDLTANVTTAGNNKGTLTFLGSTDINGTVGASGALLKQVNAGAAGETVVFNGDLYASGLVLTNTGTVKIGDGYNLYAPVTATTDGTGTLTFNGATKTGGAIGAVGNALAAVNFYGATSLGHDIAATLTTVRSGSTVTLAKNVTVTGNLTVNNAADCVLDIGMHTLTLAGTGVYRQLASGKLIVGASGATAGSIVGSGNAVVNAASVLSVQVGGFIANNTAFKVIDSAGGGTVNVPGTITSSSPLYTFAGAAALGDLTITATQAQTLNSVATGNAAAAGAVLQSVANAGATGDMQNVINAIFALPTTAAIQSSLESLVPVVDGAVTNTSCSQMNQFVTTVVNHLENAIVKAPAGLTGIGTGDDYYKGVDVWMQGFGDYAHQDAREASNGYNATVWGTALGADRPVYGENTRVGLSGGYAQSFVRSKDDSGMTDIDSWQGTLYGGYQDTDRPYYVDCAFTFAYNTYDSARNVAAGAIQRIATSDYNGQQYSVYGSFGYTFDVRKLLVTPTLSAQYMHLHVSDYTEDGAGALSLNVSGQDYDMFQTGFGAKCEYPVRLKSLTITPEFHAKWLYDFIGDTQATTSTFSGGGGSFATTGFTPAQSTWDFGAKITLLTKKDVSLAVNYDFQLKEDYWEHTGWATVSIRL